MGPACTQRDDNQRNGLLEGTGVANTNIPVDSGTILPGNTAPPTLPNRDAPTTPGGDVPGIGKLTINGNLTAGASSKLGIDIGGIVEGTSYDFLQVNGTQRLLEGWWSTSLILRQHPAIGFTLSKLPAATRANLP